MRVAAGTAIAAVTAVVTVSCAHTRRPGAATFDVRHELTVAVPEGARNVRIWFTEPQRDAAQSVRGLKVDAPTSHRQVTDSTGNSYLFFDLDRPQPGEFDVVTTFTLTRREVHSGVDASKSRPYTATDLRGMESYLEPTRYAGIDDRIRAQAREIVGDENNPVRAARSIYDWVLEHTQYWVKDPSRWKASTTGDTNYCLESGTGNCTDFHSLYMSLARASGIPTRITYGSLFKGPLNGADKDQSYHCWIEFWAPGFGWVPLDVAVADIFVGDFSLDERNEEKVQLTVADGYHGADAALVDFYFGNLDNRRVTWSRGRDLMLSPRQAGGPVNAMPKAYVEIDGRPSTDFTRKLTYSER